MSASVYMDYNASAPLSGGAAAAMSEAMAAVGNGASVHGFGRDQRRRMENAREAVAALTGAPVEGVIFTSGGTEANNLAIASKGDRRLVVSAIEHDSVRVPAARVGAATIAVSADGVIELDQLDRELASDKRLALVSLMAANNETGVMQPVAEAAEICRRHGALLHCDATQLAGRVAFRMTELGADYLTLSAHKMGGPQGAGALVVAPGIVVGAQMLGGGQERSRRAGTQNIVAIAGFGAAAASVDFAGAAGVAELRDELEARLRAFGRALKIFGEKSARLANTSCFAFPGKSAETMVMALDLAGYAISAGAACSSGKVGPSHVVLAMDTDNELARCAVRVSLGPSNNREQVRGLVEAIGETIDASGSRKDAA
jgi:cysteine desulfurase